MQKKKGCLERPEIVREISDLWYVLIAVPLDAGFRGIIDSLRVKCTLELRRKLHVSGF
jgi:hypothetical protein